MKQKILILLVVISLAVLTLITIEASDLSLFFIGMCVWSLFPWLYCALLTMVISHRKTLTVFFTCILLIGSLSITGIVDVLFIHPDAQGGLVILFLPLWQILFFLVISIPILIFRREK